MKLPFLVRKAFEIKDKVKPLKGGLAKLSVELVPKKNVWFYLWLVFSSLNEEDKNGRS